MREYIIAIDEKDVTMCFLNGMRNAELIRCKDCKYYQKIGKNGYCDHRHGLNGKPCADDYCSHAERKEE